METISNVRALSGNVIDLYLKNNFSSVLDRFECGIFCLFFYFLDREGVCSLSTPNNLCTMSLRAVPIPGNVQKFLNETNHAMRTNSNNKDILNDDQTRTSFLKELSLQLKSSKEPFFATLDFLEKFIILILELYL